MQCVCGRFFTPLDYKVNSKHSKENDLCPSCLKSSNSVGYIYSKEWDCQNITGLMFSDQKTGRGEE